MMVWPRVLKHQRRDMDSAAVTLAFAGFAAAILLVAWLPLWLERVPLTLPMLAVGVGFLAFVFTNDAASPFAHPRAATILPEVVLIVAVMGAGLSIDRRFSWRGWATSWRLLGVVMPLSIAALAALGCALLGLSPGRDPRTDRSGAGVVRAGRPAGLGRGRRDALRAYFGSRHERWPGPAIPRVGRGDRSMREHDADMRDRE